MDKKYKEFLETKRKSISIELKESYFALNSKNHKDFVSEKNSTLTLFDDEQTTPN